MIIDREITEKDVDMVVLASNSPRRKELLRDGGYLTVDKNGGLNLTEAGLEVAERTYERHTVLSEFFIKLGVSEERATADACKIEHVISTETFAALKKLNQSM